MKYEEMSENFKKQLRRDWVITNGIGGFASQSMLGINTRKYHGLLIAPLSPPARRFLVLSKVDESIEVKGNVYNLYSNMSNGYLTEGYKYIVDFKKEYMPIYTYQVDDVFIKKFICMKYGENTVTILYRVSNKTTSNAKLSLTPIINFRDFHQMSTNHNFNLYQEIEDTKVKIIIDGNSMNPIYLKCSEGEYKRHYNDMFKNMYYPIEEERGFWPEEDHSVPGEYNIFIPANSVKDISFTCSLEENIDEVDSVKVINDEVARLSELEYDSKLINNKMSEEQKDMLKMLIIATDNFVVNRPSFGLHTLIAGYPWFLDWGRDSLIAFEGLLLVTKRFEIAKEVLLTNIKDIKYGLIPNGYSGYDNRPLYNSADSSLLFFEQVHKFLQYTKNYDFIKEKIYPTMVRVAEAYCGKIDVDGNNIFLGEDGLISAGTKTTQITWMDAKANDKAVTPRNGKTVELNALWYNGLEIMYELSTKFEGKENAKKYKEMAEKVKASFNEKFYNEKKKCLYDVIGDGKIRPNQLFALSLSHPVVDPSSEIAINILNTAKEKLLNDYGLKTLASNERGYVEVYEGDPQKRDSSYHQGITWPWLLGLYYDSMKNVMKAQKNKKDYKKELIEFKENIAKTFYTEMTETATIGSISEIYDSKAPFIHRGAFAQAWSVSEVIRILTDEIESDNFFANALGKL